MIDPKELRIGNLFYPISRHTEIHLPIPTPIEIYTIGRFDIEVLTHPGNIFKGKTIKYNINDIDAIPLTPEILEHIPSSIEFANSFKLWVNKTDGGIEIEQYGEGQERLPHIKYLHQLQNLYFVLTGKELNVEL